MSRVKRATPSTKVIKRDRFGERAVKLGFCNEDQVLSAVKRQEELAAAGEAHKLIGLVMLETGAISNDQLIQVLKTYEQEHSVHE